jgi:hypothetical protein
MANTDTPEPVTGEDGLVGVNPEADLSVSEEKRERGLRYCSKSRIKTYKQCPRKLWYKYWCEYRPPGNFYTERGTQVHRVFEEFHENASEYIQKHGEIPSPFTALLESWRDYGQWTEMVGNFFKFELRRAFLVEDPHNWEPTGVEVEGWLGEPPADYERADPDYVNPDGPPVGDIPWMGKADSILPTESVPGIEGDGVVILDYKTGSVPDKQYRDEGIFLEGEYYGWLFEEFYDVDAVAGYYPQADKLITAPYPDKQRRYGIKRAVLGMQEMPEVENFPINEQPLCHYGHGRCYFYSQCPSKWGKRNGPGHNKAE